MVVTVRGKNIEITPALRDYVEKRIQRITKYFSEVGEVHALLTVVKGDHIVEVTVTVNGMILRSQEMTDDMYSSIDLVVDKIERQISKHKNKLTDRFRNAPDHQFRSELLPDQHAEDEEFRIIKTKRFTVKPMSVEEAIMQMNLINHDFFVFLDSDENVCSVVYRRKDGDYGLIAPEMK